MKLTFQSFSLAITFLFMVGILLLRPIDDVDTFRVIKEGQLMIIRSKLITKDIFTYTHYGENVAVTGWLASLAFALLYNIGSWGALQLFHAYIYAGAFIVSVKFAKQDNSISLFSLLSAVLLGFLVALPNSSVRPQTLGLFCFAILFSVFQSDLRFTTKFFLSILISLIWQNTHPSLAAGIVVVSASFAAKSIVWLSRKEPSKLLPDLIIISSLVFLQFATPMGWDIVSLSTTNTEVARNLLNISEWLPPWHPTIIEPMIPFWFALFLSLIFVGKLRFKISILDLSVFIAMSAMALYACRFAIFWAISMIPIWARWIDCAKPKKLFNFSKDIKLSKCSIFISLSVGILLTSSTPFYLRGSTFDKKIPIRGIEHLKILLPEGRIYNYREWGGPLILEGYPGWKLAIDGRLYLFKANEWRQYNRTAQGDVNIETLERKHNPDIFFLRPSFHRKLIELLDKASDWKKVYEDEYAVIFIRENRKKDRI